MQDEIARKMASMEWSFGDRDPLALATLEKRIAETGRRLGLVTYSELVTDVVFHLPNPTLFTEVRVSRVLRR